MHQVLSWDFHMNKSWKWCKQINHIISWDLVSFGVGMQEGMEYFVSKCWNNTHGMHNSQCGTLLYVCFIMRLISGQVQALCTYHKLCIVNVSMNSHICKKLCYTIWNKTITGTTTSCKRTVWEWDTSKALICHTGMSSPHLVKFLVALIVAHKCEPRQHFHEFIYNLIEYSYSKLFSYVKHHWHFKLLHTCTFCILFA